MRRAVGSLFAVGMLALSAAGAAADPGDGDDVAFTFADPRIDESSGLVAQDDVVVTVNDSGDSNRIFTVDTASGETVGVTSWQGDAVDVEALAPAGRGEVWVADIGDNQRSRRSVTVAKVPFAVGDRTTEAPTYELVYPDGPHDAETLLADPRTGRLYVVVKELRGRVFAAPPRLSADGPNRLTEVGTTLGFSTDGAFFPDGRHVILRNYVQAAVYTWPDLERLETFALPVQRQGEGIATTGPAEAMISSEGARSSVLRVALPPGLATKMSSTSTATPEADDSQPAESAAADEPGRDVWPWALGGIAGIVVIGVLLRALRPR